MPRITRYTGASNWAIGLGPRVTTLHTVVGKGIIPTIVAEEDKEPREERRKVVKSDVRPARKAGTSRTITSRATIQ